MWPLHNIGQAVDATAQAIKHHPIKFPYNLNQARKAIDNDEWGDAGMYIGIDTHWVLDEIE